MKAVQNKATTNQISNEINCKIKTLQCVNVVDITQRCSDTYIKMSIKCQNHTYGENNQWLISSEWPHGLGVHSCRYMFIFFFSFVPLRCMSIENKYWTYKRNTHKQTQRIQDSATLLWRENQTRKTETILKIIHANRASKNSTTQTKTIYTRIQ